MTAPEGYPGELIPRPDPTTLTNAAVTQAKEDLRREIAALREVLETQVIAAGQELARTWELHRSDIGRARDELGALREVVFEKFTERDLRFAQAAEAARDAQAAALQTARELIDTKAEATAAAADKFQEAVVRQINDQTRTTSESMTRMADQIHALEQRLIRGEGTQTGTEAAHSDLRLNLGVIIAGLAMIVSVVLGILLYIKK